MKERKGRFRGQYSKNLVFGRKPFLVIGLKSLENGYIYPSQLWPLLKKLRYFYKRNKLAYKVTLFFFKKVSSKKQGIRMGASKGDLWRNAFLLKKGFLFIEIRTRSVKRYFFLKALLFWLTKSLSTKTAIIIKRS